MEDEQNFDELIGELDSLGINTRDISGTIWQAIQQEVSLKAISYHDEQARIVLDIGLDDSYRTSLFDYAVYYPITPERSHVQAFDTDVPLSDAKKLLQLRIKKNIDEPIGAYEPMSQREVIQELNTLNQNVMNTQNAEFLKKSLLNLGFGEKLNTELDKEMAAKTPEFKLGLQHEFNQKTVDYTLHFKAGDNQDMYFFNKYDATINHKDDSAKNIDQTFFINKGSGITAKEAFNLMEGRAVHKQLYNLEGQKYQAWLTLDDKNLTENGNKKIKHYHENYGYDLEKVIAGKGIRELEDPKTKEELLYSLKKGNAQQITIGGDDGDKKYFIAANPQYKTVDLFDHQMKKIKREELLQTDQKPVRNLKQREQQKEDAPAKKQSRKAKVHV
ncbi:hypothetical protein [Mucilaginibacter gossypii]|uniref:DUF3945 domain-containing protein n=1 Tax=Mucilaginibacter gossypii TaxID=551996 RepID=A0A1G7RM91_9SPHI|nr:hypothetical protein [Mucilaginibacter gossypii]SDG11200.1 hypothetical protein SAMN05192573_102271 [Mucilaginibacter gossypii]